MRASLAAAGFALVASACVVARADDETPPPARDTHWYGWQNLAVDGVSLGLVAGAVPAGRGPGNEDRARAMAIVGAVGWLTFSPLVHLGHHRPEIAGASLGIRAIPLLVLFMSFNGTCTENANANGETCHTSTTEPLVVAGITTLGALLVDDLVLAREDARKSPSGFVRPDGLLRARVRRTLVDADVRRRRSLLSRRVEQ